MPYIPPLKFGKENHEEEFEDTIDNRDKYLFQHGPGRKPILGEPDYDLQRYNYLNIKAREFDMKKCLENQRKIKLFS